MSSVSLNLNDNLSAIDAANSSSGVTIEDESSALEMQDLEFLEMLTTQLKYQDPMNPSDNQAFAEQMATMTTMQTNNDQLEMLEQIKQGLEGMSLSMYASSAAMTNSATVGMINKEVKIATDVIHVEGDDGAELDIDISTMNANAEMVITDQFGEEVFRSKVSAMLSDTSEGEHEYTWDRMSTDGIKQLEGEYGVRFEVDGDYYNAMSIIKQDVVTGVRFEGDTASVTINGNNYPVARIIEVL